jgi:hypothetical protein
MPPLRREFRWDRERREPTEAGLPDPDEGEPAPPPVAPPLIRCDMATLRYDMSVGGRRQKKGGKKGGKKRRNVLDDFLLLCRKQATLFGVPRVS